MMTSPTRRKTALLFSILLCSAAHTSVKADPEQRPWYLGADLGLAYSEVRSQHVNERLAAQGLQGSADVDNRRRLAGLVYGGWQFHPHMALQAGYVDLGELSVAFSSLDSALDTSDLDTVWPRSGSGIELSLQGRLQMTQNLSGFAQLGLFNWRGSYQLDGSGTHSIRGTDPVFGMGAQWKLSDRWATRLNWSRYQLDDDHTQLIAVGLVARFGQQSRPEPIAPKTAPVPVVDLEERAPEPEKEPDSPSPAELEPKRWVINFGFDEAGKKLSEALLAEISELANDHPDARIVLIGFTDNTGPTAYNQQLSEERAGRVKSSLLEEGIEEDRIQTKGLGPKHPAATNDTAEGRAKNRRVEIHLLPPDTDNSQIPRSPDSSE